MKKSLQSSFVLLGLILASLSMTGCTRTVVQVQGDTMVTRYGVSVMVTSVLVGLLIVALGVLLAIKGKSGTKRVVGGILFIGFGAAFAVFSVMCHGKFYVKGNGERIEQAIVLFGESKVTELDPVTHVSVHRVRRKRRGKGGPKRKWVTLLWLHRPDGTHDELVMGGQLGRPVLEHVLQKLAERGVRVDDYRNQEK